MEFLVDSFLAVYLGAQTHVGPHQVQSVLVVFLLKLSHHFRLSHWLFWQVPLQLRNGLLHRLFLLQKLLCVAVFKFFEDLVGLLLFLLLFRLAFFRNLNVLLLGNLPLGLLGKIPFLNGLFLTRLL